MVKRGPCDGLKHQKEKRSMDHFAGLDASVKETSVCIVDEAGRIVREVKVAIGALRSAPRLSAPPLPARKPTALPAKRGTSGCSAIAAKATITDEFAKYGVN